MFQKTTLERQRALTGIHSSATGWYGLLIANDPTSVVITDIDTDTGFITAVGHDFVNGNRITFSNTGGSLPSNIFSGGYYNIINVDGASFQVCTSSTYNQISKTGIALAISSAGSGVTTINEQALSPIDDFDIWVRKEVPDYYGSSRRSFSPPPATINIQTQLASVGPINITFTPTSGSITFRYFAVISGGNGDRGDNQGILAGIEDFVFTQTIDTTGRTFLYNAVI
ncbi:hypothetical protein [Trichormus variabilis]|uniref:Uncharacterized protein n=1 Tax=Trichormus variabilis SAG 1403-4b TaxID=447716 RepID=A0A3S1I5L0_ANAVA|nr:hypothetical protein [Trichormus variabilis]MBD2628492.1 hypothetical protein [Trichormus variabilis FACHB-164]RUS92504.1 hypothetical protein DSM107003_49870 [Trichormus variabilis SAG 1403-4b]